MVDLGRLHKYLSDLNNKYATFTPSASYVRLFREKSKAEDEACFEIGKTYYEMINKSKQKGKLSAEGYKRREKIRKKLDYFHKLYQLWYARKEDTQESILLLQKHIQNGTQYELIVRGQLQAGKDNNIGKEEGLIGHTI